jgi:hypothetical protein
MKCHAQKRILLWGLVGLGAAVLVGCQHSHGARGSVVVGERVVASESRPHPGPPDHAPAHGWRRKHGIQHPTQSHKRAQGETRTRVELVYDGDLGVHVVVDHAGVYFHGDHYFRMSAAGWEWSGHLAGSWTVAPDHGVPTGLRELAREQGSKVTKRKGPAHPHGRGHPAKRAE